MHMAPIILELSFNLYSFFTIQGTQGYGQTRPYTVCHAIITL